MGDNAGSWALVLAAGEGSRLRRLTTTAAGVAVPKQFCSLLGGPSLLHEALRRAGSFAARERICTVVARDHRQWWEPTLRGMPPENVIVQPANRGTGIGILLPLLHILPRDPRAIVVILPSDHHVRDERRLAAAIGEAISRVAMRDDELDLLGVEPDDVDPDLGYIVPGRDDGHGARCIRRFVEKPPTEAARQLVRDGALWNAFIVAARAGTLLRLLERRFPAVVTAMREAVVRDAVGGATATATQEVYRTLPVIDFSRDVVEGSESALRVVTVPRCGWSDLGTPARVGRALERISGSAATGPDALRPFAGCIDLSARRAELGAQC